MKDLPDTGMTSSLLPMQIRMRAELRDRLKSFDFTYFITLATSHQQFSPSKMRSLLKQWDARVNRSINGPRWARRPDERLIWFAFLEKASVNPHWHLIVEVDPWIIEGGRAQRTSKLPDVSKQHWEKLVPQGTFDCQDVESPAVIDYVTKVVAAEQNFENFILSREFINN
ncbi:hypothetical protein E4Z66_18150 [Aliishimia ponticola]|uniref:Inovirus Gp2 family protein n=1 Tax=Aliishimia ponticola TaxID=2499833 RepID=A0A4S4N775_9RHOB|nr:hypothetical protein [Aliishimia ponticola]THH34365.1 hypothetical protein E4Z66_18150 [Aliishimia ponticola]